MLRPCESQQNKAKHTEGERCGQAWWSFSRRWPVDGEPTKPRPGGAFPGPGLPKMVLVGDSIRLGYAPGVAERLAGKAVVISPPENGGDSANVLAHLDEWVIRQKPDVVHLNCGLHDLKRSKKDGHHQVELDRYAENLRRIVARIREGTDAALVFADTTPILDERHARRGADFDRTEADVRRYNAAAIAVMGELGVPVHDLHWVVEQGGPETMLGPDGTHYTAAGSDRLAEAVADCVLRQVTVRRYRPLPRPASGARSRRGVPQGRRPCAMRWSPRPTGGSRSASSASRRTPPTGRSSGRPSSATVLESLGDLPPRPSPPRARIISREIRPGYTLEKVCHRQRRGRRGDGATARPGALGRGRCRRSSGCTRRRPTRRR